MKSENILTALNDIDPELVSDAEQVHRRPASVSHMKWGAVAAVLCLVFGLVLGQFLRTPGWAILGTWPYTTAPTAGTSISIPTTRTPIGSLSTIPITRPTSPTQIIPITVPTFHPQTTTIPTPTQPTTIPTPTQPTEPIETTVPPPFSPAIFHIREPTCEKLFSELEKDANAMGGKEMLRSILFSQYLDPLKDEIHWVEYYRLMAEPTNPKDAGETIELTFHPKEYCVRAEGRICAINSSARKLRLYINYRPTPWSPSEYDLSESQKVQDDPLVYKVVLRDVTQFRYFFGCYYFNLTVDTAYMGENSEVVEQFQAYILSIGALVMS